MNSAEFIHVIAEVMQRITDPVHRLPDVPQVPSTHPGNHPFHVVVEPVQGFDVVAKMAQAAAVMHDVMDVLGKLFHLVRVLV